MDIEDNRPIYRWHYKDSEEVLDKNYPWKIVLDESGKPMESEYDDGLILMKLTEEDEEEQENILQNRSRGMQKKLGKKK